MHNTNSDQAPKKNGDGAVVLMVKEANGRYVVASDAQVVAAAETILWRKLSGERLSDPNAVIHFLQAHLACQEREVFTAIFLDTRNRVIAVEDLFFGSIDSASVYPREVVKAALRHNAAALIVSHCHPSGDPEPSEADRIITKHLSTALALVEVRLLDHFVIGRRSSAVSLAQRGWV